MIGWIILAVYLAGIPIAMMCLFKNDAFNEEFGAPTELKDWLDEDFFDIYVYGVIGLLFGVIWPLVAIWFGLKWSVFGLLRLAVNHQEIKEQQRLKERENTNLKKVDKTFPPTL